jgi:hypothetical protein
VQAATRQLIRVLLSRDLTIQPAIRTLLEQATDDSTRPPGVQKRELISANEASKRLRFKRSKFYRVRTKYPELKPCYFDGTVSYRADLVDALIGRLPNHRTKIPGKLEEGERGS